MFGQIKTSHSHYSTVPPKPKCDYIMIVPFKLTSGSQGTVCTWLKSEVPVNITVDLEYFSQKLPIVSKPVTSESYDCTEFTVSNVLSATKTQCSNISFIQSHHL